MNDKGVLMVCDPRLLKRAYGQQFLDSMPSMKRSRDIKDVEDFFKLNEQDVSSKKEVKKESQK